MNELDIARAIAAGSLPSAQKFFGSTFFAMRFTGTGVAWRDAIGEHCWRDPRIWLTDAMCRRIVGVPLIVQHVEKVLQGDQLNERIAGIITLGFLKDTELWCVVRVVDQEIADLLNTGEFDTSPTVLFDSGAGNTIINIREGERLLVEWEPTFIDHLAICAAGVWSKGGRAEPAIETQDMEKVAA